MAVFMRMTLFFVFPDLEKEERELQRKKAALRDAKAVLDV